MKSLLDHPELRRLLGKGGPRSDFRKPRQLMASKVLPDPLIRIQTQKLTDHFHRDHFTIAQLGAKPRWRQR